VTALARTTDTSIVSESSTADKQTIGINVDDQSILRLIRVTSFS
jgi:hypothetical protein